MPNEIAQSKKGTIMFVVQLFNYSVQLSIIVALVAVVEAVVVL